MLQPPSINEDIDLLRDTVRRFADEEIAPRAAEIDTEQCLSTGPVAQAGRTGSAGHHHPRGIRRLRMGYLAHVVAMEEISRASASVGLSYGAHSNLCVDNLYRSGNDEQRQRFLPKLCSGEWVGALAMSEPGAGSDVVGSMRCRAEKKGDGWITNGSKMWITNGPEASVVLAYMRTADQDAGSRCMTAFIVERDMPGYSTAQKMDKLGMRGSNTCELFLTTAQSRTPIAWARWTGGKNPDGRAQFGTARTVRRPGGDHASCHGSRHTLCA